MKLIWEDDAAESFAVFTSGFPVPAEAVPGDALSVIGSNVANGSRRALESGFPRRRRGRFGSSIGSSDVEVEAFALCVSDVAGGFVASGVVGALVGGALVGGAGGVAGFCSSFLSFSFSLFEPLSESALSLWR